MAVAIAVARDHVFNGVRHFVGNVAYAILHAVDAFRRFVLPRSAVRAASSRASRASSVSSSVVWSCGTVSDISCLLEESGWYRTVYPVVLAPKRSPSDRASPACR